MEYLYVINPILMHNKPIIIYGVGMEEKAIFYALLQQKIYVTAFCVRDGQNKVASKIFNKNVISKKELKEKYSDAQVVVAAKYAIQGCKELEEMKITNILIDNSTLNENGILLLGE